VAFQINKVLAIRLGPFDKGLEDLILNTTEQLVQQEKRNSHIKLFAVEYQEMKSTKPGYRMFKIKEAFNERDK